jgi:alkyl sulfatase BDS1-like metallo-beta-lactamase superfamily hydrolase
MAGNEPDLERLVRAGESATAAEKIADGIYASHGISNAYLVTTSDGDVLVNAGMNFEGPRTKERFAAVSGGPVRVLVYTQGHGDHIGGTAALAGPETKIIAQADYPVVRGYWNRLMEFYGRRTQVLWRSVIRSRDQLPAQPPDPVPDVLFQDRHAFELGGRRFELLSTPGGETTDSLVVWLPKERIVFTGNLFGPIFGHLPNLYTIRGDKIRSALRFLASLGLVRDLDPGLLVTGHGDPIRGKDQICDGLTRIRDATQWIHDRTVEGMNAGKDVDTLMAEIALPPELAVGQGHGKTSWCVRAIWEEYAGWFHYQSTTELYPVPARAVHPDVVELAGAEALVRRGREHADGGRPVEALHLTDMVLAVDAADRAALEVRAAALETLLERAGGENFSEVQWLRGRLAETREALSREDQQS